MKKLFVWTVILFALTACGDIQPIAEVEQPQPAESQKTITLTATVRAGDPATKVLIDQTTKIVTEWEINEEIALIYKKSDGRYARVAAKVKSVTAGVATIVADIEGITLPSDEIETRLIYPFSAVDYPGTDTYTKYDVKENLLLSQKGTLAKISEFFDVRKGEAKMVIDNTGTATFKGGDVTLTNQNCIWKLTLQSGVDALEPSTLVITMDAKEYTITPADATQPLYVALPPIEGKAVSFKATESNVNYYFSKESVTLKASKYYESTVAMSTDFGLLPGKFSVSDSKMVQFSKGNLQWFYGDNAHKVDQSSDVSSSTSNQNHFNGGVFTFAEHQYDICAGSDDGIDRGSDKIESNKGKYDANKKIDLFMYATSGYKSTNNVSDNQTYHYKPFAIYWGYSYESRQNPSANLRFGPQFGIDGSGANNKKSDWGVFNAILNGGDETGMWRTLTYKEWDYLLNKRGGETNAFAKRGVGIVNGVYGVILLPDFWTLPAGLTFTPLSEVIAVAETHQSIDYNWNNYNTTQWALMEAAGAVFLPAAGVKQTDQYGTVVGNNDSTNNEYLISYWTASTSLDGSSAAWEYAYAVDLGQENASTKNWRFDKSNRACGRAVRLVHDVQ